MFLFYKMINFANEAYCYELRKKKYFNEKHGHKY